VGTRADGHVKGGNIEGVNAKRGGGWKSAAKVKDGAHGEQAHEQKR